MTRSLDMAHSSDWLDLAALPSAWTGRYTASFSVNPEDRRDDAWQQFPSARFNTRVLAAANALALAHRSIDSKLNEA